MDYINVISLIFVIYDLQTCGTSSNNYPPRKNIWDPWLESLMNFQIQNMTADLIKDVTSKMMYAEKVTDNHKGAPAAVLGKLASRVKLKFQDMVDIYKKYSPMEVLKYSNYSRYEMMDAYFEMQSQYHILKEMGNAFYDTYARIYRELTEKAKARAKRRKKRKKRKLKTKVRAGPDDMPMRAAEEKYKSELRMRKHMEEFVFNTPNSNIEGDLLNY